MVSPPSGIRPAATAAAVSVRPGPTSIRIRSSWAYSAATASAQRAGAAGVAGSRDQSAGEAASPAASRRPV